MASLSSDGPGRWRITFRDPKQRTIRLGKVSRRKAEGFLLRVEDLIGARTIGRLPDDETLKWLRDLDSKMRRRLAAAGLAQVDKHSAITLEDLFREFLASLNIKPGTLRTYQQTRDSLFSYFGKTTTPRDIGPLEADQWRQKMKADGLAQPTISKRIKTARQGFKKAKRWGMVSENPFDDVKAGTQTNRARLSFVGPQVTQKILDACPDCQWRAIFALARFGGLRCPSEILRLKWGDVNWDDDEGSIVIHDEKREGYEGKETRRVPLFPEIRPYLLAAFSEAAEGSKFVVTRYRDTSANLRTQFKRILNRAGVTIWPKLFQNLRSTRETELAARYPLADVCSWIGNSPEVARRHYLQATGEQFRAAVRDHKKPASNPASHTSPQRDTEKQMTHATDEKSPTLSGGDAVCSAMGTESVTPTGSERPHRSTGETGAQQKSGIKSGSKPTVPGRYVTHRGRVKQRVPRPTAQLIREATRRQVSALLNRPV